MELTPLGKGSFEIACLAVGGTIAAIDAVLAGEVRNAYALVRSLGCVHWRMGSPDFAAPPKRSYRLCWGKPPQSRLRHVRLANPVDLMMPSLVGS